MSFVILGFLISGFSCNRGTIYRDSCPTGNGIILSGLCFDWFYRGYRDSQNGFYLSLSLPG